MRKREPWAMVQLIQEISEVQQPVEYRASDPDPTFRAYRTIEFTGLRDSLSQALEAAGADPRIVAVERDGDTVTVRFVPTHGADKRDSFGVSGAVKILTSTADLEDEQADLEQMTKVELLDRLAEIEPEGSFGKMTKAELVTAVLSRIG